ncbi:aspartate aminotransferase family protein [bacterium]|nr:aspartate aminotransferase family protein [bacterium]
MTPTQEQNRAQALEQKHHLQLYKRYPVTFVDGKGSILTDSEGKKYIDALAGIAVNSVGHCHPQVVNAIQEQAAKLIHVSNLYFTEPQSELAERLTRISGMDRVFFTNSGTEAVEGAIKLAKRRGANKGRRGQIISFDGCFHGRSSGPLSAHSAKQKQAFEPLLPGFAQLPFGDEQILRHTVDDNTLAILIEPVQGEGGVRAAPDSFLQLARQLCDEHDALLIVDEVQCGVGRTGSWWGFQQSGVKPDIMTVGKALGGGYPIGAVLATEEAAGHFAFGDHGTTFGGNALGCAAANATLKVFEEEKLVERAAEMGEYARHKLQKAAESSDRIQEVRGRGMMIGVNLAFEGKKLVVELMEKGVLANCTADTVIRFLPPLTISKEELDQVLDTFLEVLAKHETEGQDA